jgi:hypothetical protein
MPLECEGLASYGVILIPPGSQQYFDLLADIERRLQNRPKGGPPIGREALSQISEHGDSNSAILVNRASTAIASLAYVWSLRNADGRITTSSYLPEGSHPSVLLPFLQLDRFKKFDAFWNTIFSGSKRLLTVDGGMYGDNTDIRAPAEDELSEGGFFSLSGGSKQTGEAVKLTLDGVFFVNGGFAGPNRLTSWEQVVAARAAYLSYAALARSASSTAVAQSDFFAQVQQLSGLAEGQSLPAPPPPRALPGRSTVEGIQHYQRAIAQRVLMMRHRLGDAATLAAVGAWEDTPGPEPHRL